VVRRFHVSGEGIIHAAASELLMRRSRSMPEGARILGAVDMEIRWMHRFESPSVPANLPRIDNANTGASESEPGRSRPPGEKQAGLTLRKLPFSPGSLAVFQR